MLNGLLIDVADVTWTRELSLATRVARHVCVRLFA